MFQFCYFKTTKLSLDETLKRAYVFFMYSELHAWEKYQQDILKRSKQEEKLYWQLQKIRELWQKV